MKIQFAHYKFAPAAISAGIRWWSHSLYSHVAIVVLNDAGEIVWVYEAIASGFVRAKTLAENHHEVGLTVDLFEYLTPPTAEQVAKMVEYLESIVGWKYDVAGIASFVTGNLIPENPCRVFCSEVAGEMSLRCGIPLQNVKASNLMPRDTAMSLATKFVRSIDL